MKLKTFANIDLSTREARNEVTAYLSSLQCDFNICENTPEEIVNCEYSMLKALRALNNQLLFSYIDFYTEEDRLTRIEFIGREQKCFEVFLRSAYMHLNKIQQFGVGADEFIPAIRKTARQLRIMVANYAVFSIKVADYKVSLIN